MNVVVVVIIVVIIIVLVIVFHFLPPYPREKRTIINSLDHEAQGVEAEASCCFPISCKICCNLICHSFVGFLSFEIYRPRSIHMQHSTPSPEENTLFRNDRANTHTCSQHVSTRTFAPTQTSCSAFSSVWECFTL